MEKNQVKATIKAYRVMENGRCIAQTALKEDAVCIMKKAKNERFYNDFTLIAIHSYK